MQVLTGSVGTGGMNRHADVLAVQKLLNKHRGRLPKIAEDGLIGPETVGAISEFQKRVVGMGLPDGRVDVNGNTWKKLTAGGGGVAPPAAPPPAAGGTFSYPMARVIEVSWHLNSRGGGYFACNRGGGARAHAGCDLYAPLGTPIYAVGAGTVVRGPYDFYASTDAIEVDHGSFLARYGEVRPGRSKVKAGDPVAAGQQIAEVGHLVGINAVSDMLHFEMYSKGASGPLTVSAAAGKKRSDGVPFQRRTDLMDPTSYLDRWKNTLPRV